MVLSIALKLGVCSALTTTREPVGDFISPDAFRSIADFIYEGGDEQTASTIPKLPSLKEQERKILKNLSKGDVIYVYVKCLDHFIKNVHPKIRCPYIFLCTDDDNPIFDKRYLSFINDPKIINCYVRNINIDHPKVQPIPIGIANPFWEMFYHKRDTTIISDFLNIDLPRDGFVYMNINTGTFPLERCPVWDLFHQSTFVTTLNGVCYKDYLTDLKQHRFCISPSGNGVECHRTWESMYMGCIPIIRPMVKVPLFEPAVGYDKLYYDLPVILVSDWKDVTEEFLNEKFEEFKHRKFNMDKLYFPYWKNLIKTESLQYKRKKIR
jgi:hypothetical protein